MEKQRLDILMVEKNIVSSRERAKALILSLSVLVDGNLARKAGEMYSANSSITLKEPDCPYVGRGGLKLEKALREFSIELTGLICIDVGASTGGFTDCMLSHGAAKVYAVDVGYGQLAWKLRTDSRVVIMERMNARYLSLEDFEEVPVFASIDVSFISIGLIMPALKKIGVREVVALIKPQFEAGREKVGKKGIIRDKDVHMEVLRDVLAKMKELGYYAKGLTYSPIRGQNGNIEFLAFLSLGQEEIGYDICKIVEESHEII